MSKRNWFGVGAVVTLIAAMNMVGAGSARAQDITEFRNGYISFTNENPALYYRVEFKPNLTGSEEWDGSFRGLRNIQSPDPEVTVPVGVFYRVVGRDMPWVAGTALASDILSGKTAYVNDEEVTGTMPNVGAQNVTPGTSAQAIPQGYHDGTGSVAGDTDLVAENIKVGATIFDVEGTAVESTGDATAGQVLVGATFSKAGETGLTGTMPNQADRGFMPGTAHVPILAGYYDGSGVVTGDAALVTGNIRAGVTLFGVDGTVLQASGDAAAADVLTGRSFSRVDAVDLEGTMPNVGQANMTPGTAAQAIPQGYHDGTGSVAGDTDLLAENIKKDVAIFGVTGTMLNAAVPKTGQTTSYQTGDDGTHQKGVAWLDPRFTVTTNGTDEVVTDNMTGLMWVKAPNSLDGTGTMFWNPAIDFCNGLTFAGQSDWRLPNVRELQSLIDYGHTAPALPSGHPFTGVQSELYWSSSTIANSTGTAWFVNLYRGQVSTSPKTYEHRVWPVRAGQ